MCGIAGYFSVNKYPHEILDGMLLALEHRGPDDCGVYTNDNYVAGMRRLSINDLETGSQPLFNEDKTIVLFYNGEIYNFKELKKYLEGLGHRFRTKSDGEVICHLYEEEGDDAFARLDGMFAAAIWLVKDKKLVLARDLPGEKPLYYADLPNGELAFASEIKSLTKFKAVPKDLNYQAIWDLPTFLWVPEPETIYQGIKSLLPGQILVKKIGSTQLKSYSNQFDPWPKEVIELPERELIALVKKTVEAAVTSRLLSDVPIGSFLSGGLDSSIVATIAAKNVERLSTFTIGFENLIDPYHGLSDESAQAEAYAKVLGGQHQTIRVRARDFRDKLKDFCFYGDQPQAVSSGLGILVIAEAARQAGIKVLLTGDGADECFGGYSWYPCLANKVIDDKMNHDVVSFQNFGLSINDRLAAINSYDAPKRAWAWHYYASEKEKIDLFNDNIFGDQKSSLRFFSDFKSSNDWSSEDYIKQDRLFYFPNEMLRKVDRLTMAYSVEGRAPFAAPAILALADHLSFKQLIRGDKLKWVLRQAFRDVLPAKIINRQKHGFNVPIDHWLKNDWSDLVADTFSSSSALAQKGIIAPAATKIAQNMLNDPLRLSGHSIFSFIMLNMWLENNS